jgi:hypothetical protein
MSSSMFDIIKYCQSRQATMAQEKSRIKKTSTNDATITKAAGYTQYLRTTSPKPLNAANIVSDPSSSDVYVGLVYGLGIRTI